MQSVSSIGADDATAALAIRNRTRWGAWSAMLFSLVLIIGATVMFVFQPDFLNDDDANSLYPVKIYDAGTWYDVTDLPHDIHTLRTDPGEFHDAIWFTREDTPGIYFFNNYRNDLIWRKYPLREGEDPAAVQQYFPDDALVNQGTADEGYVWVDSEQYFGPGAFAGDGHIGDNFVTIGQHEVIVNSADNLQRYDDNLHLFIHLAINDHIAGQQLLDFDGHYIDDSTFVVTAITADQTLHVSHENRFGEQLLHREIDLIETISADVAEPSESWYRGEPYLFQLGRIVYVIYGHSVFFMDMLADEPEWQAELHLTAPWVGANLYLDVNQYGLWINIPDKDSSVYRVAAPGSDSVDTQVVRYPITGQDMASSRLLYPTFMQTRNSNLYVAGITGIIRTTPDQLDDPAGLEWEQIFLHNASGVSIRSIAVAGYDQLWLLLHTEGADDSASFLASIWSWFAVTIGIIFIGSLLGVYGLTQVMRPTPPGIDYELTLRDAAGYLPDPDLLEGGDKRGWDSTPMNMLIAGVGFIVMVSLAVGLLVFVDDIGQLFETVEDFWRDVIPGAPKWIIDALVNLTPFLALVALSLPFLIWQQLREVEREKRRDARRAFLQFMGGLLILPVGEAILQNFAGNAFIFAILVFLLYMVLPTLVGVRDVKEAREQGQATLETETQDMTPSIRAEQSNNDAYMLIAETMDALQEGDLRTAQDKARTGLALTINRPTYRTHTPLLLTVLAQIHMAQGRTREAEKAAKGAIILHKTDFRGLAMLGELHLLDDQHPFIAHKLLQLAHKNTKNSIGTHASPWTPRDIMASLAAARAQTASTERDSAEDLYEQAQENISGNPYMQSGRWWRLGLAALALGRREKAQEAFEQAVALQPDGVFGQVAQQSLARLV